MSATGGTITLEEIPAVVAGVLIRLKEAKALACLNGVEFSDPKSIDFSFQVVLKRNAVSRSQVTDPTTSTTTGEQLTDSVTTHGRSNEEDRLNRGERVTTHTSTTEDSD